MITIDELVLKDFQTHKLTTVKFSPHFNVIVGPTRSGKSSLVRALDFFLYNNWYEDYQRFYSDYTEVTGKLSNGKIIKRTKSDKINRITITTGKDVERFEGFGINLPQEVVRAIGVHPIQIGSKDSILANVTNQDDPLFLLYATGTDRTKVLSRLSGLHWLDFALKDLNASRLSNSKLIQETKEANEKALEKLKTFKNLPEFKNKLTVEKERLSRLKYTSSLVGSGQLIVNKIIRWKNDYQAIQKLKKINYALEIPRLEKLLHLQESLIQPLHDLKSKYSSNTYSLNNIKSQLITLKDSIARVTEDLSKISVCSECGRPYDIGDLHEQEHA